MDSTDPLLQRLKGKLNRQRLLFHPDKNGHPEAELALPLGTFGNLWEPLGTFGNLWEPWVSLHLSALLDGWDGSDTVVK